MVVNSRQPERSAGSAAAKSALAYSPALGLCGESTFKNTGFEVDFRTLHIERSRRKKEGGITTVKTNMQRLLFPARLAPQTRISALIFFGGLRGFRKNKRQRCGRPSLYFEESKTPDFGAMWVHCSSCLGVKRQKQESPNMKTRCFAQSCFVGIRPTRFGKQEPSNFCRKRTKGRSLRASCEAKTRACFFETAFRQQDRSSTDYLWRTLAHTAQCCVASVFWCM